ncbi:MAG TPA: outer membrane beta-barrel protein [Marinagarivorans sp.]
MAAKGIGLTSITLASILLCSPAIAEYGIEDTGWFVGGFLSQAKVELKNGSTQLKTQGPMFEARGGYRFSPYFALEGGLGITAATDSTRDQDFDDAAVVKLSSAAKLIAPIADHVQLYANAGLALLSYAHETPYRSRYYSYRTTSYTGNTFLIGLGVEFELSKNLVMRIAYDSMRGDISSDDYYTYYPDDLDVTLTQFGFGLHYQF